MSYMATVMPHDTAWSRLRAPPCWATLPATPRHRSICTDHRWRRSIPPSLTLRTRNCSIAAHVTRNASLRRGPREPHSSACKRLPTAPLASSRQQHMPRLPTARRPPPPCRAQRRRREAVMRDMEAARRGIRRNRRHRGKAVAVVWKRLNNRRRHFGLAMSLRTGRLSLRRCFCLFNRVPTGSYFSAVIDPVASYACGTRCGGGSVGADAF